jgi:hypothetical protein
MGKIQKYRISPTTWAKAQDLIITRPDIPLVRIAEKMNIPPEILRQKAAGAGWLNLRDLADVERATEKIQHIIKDLAFQINDFHEHASAMVEALQFAHRIQIVRDPMGHLHYQNMPPVWPGKPDNFSSMTQEEQQKALNTIEPRRLQVFTNDMMSINAMKGSNFNFITKMLKGSLPKIDPIALDISRRDADVDIEQQRLDVEDYNVVDSTEEEADFNPDLLKEQLEDFNQRKIALQEKIEKAIQENKENNNE